MDRWKTPRWKTENNYVLTSDPPLLACKRGAGKGCPCRHPGKGIFTPVWTAEQGRDAVAPGRRKLSQLKAQYAQSIGCVAVYRNSCERCSDEHTRIAWAATNRKREEARDYNDRCKERGELHLRKCMICFVPEGKNKSGFENDTILGCLSCTGVKKKQEAEKIVKNDNATDVCESYCTMCGDTKGEHEFQKVFVNISTQERTLRNYSGCVDCLEKDKTRPRLTKRGAVQKSHEMSMEKLKRWREYKKANQSCTGCGHGCPCDFDQLERELYRLFYDKYLGDEDQARQRTNKILAAMLEWDHNHPLEKSKCVSEIWIDAERWAEIAKCTLRCMFCHRLKTWKCGDGIAPEKKKYNGRVTRERLRAHLELKLDRLNSNLNKGECISYLGSCPMKVSIQAFLKKDPKDFKTTLPIELLLMFLYDFDHRDPTEKITSVWSNLSEAEKCDLRCCFCHRIKTLERGENIWRRLYIAYRKKEGEELDGDLGEELGAGTQMESRGESEEHIDMDIRGDTF